MKQVTETIQWGAGGRSKYDWDTILDGTTWELVEGEDFTCGTGSFRSAVIGAAKKRSLTVRTQIKGDSVIVLAEGMLTEPTAELVD